MPLYNLLIFFGLQRNTPHPPARVSFISYKGLCWDWVLILFFK
jgi:hypothetical protein